MLQEQTHANCVYRIDKFVVPNTARHEFLDAVQMTHDLLRTQSGFLQDFLLEQPLDDDHFNLMTVVEWENSDAVKNARTAVQSMQAERNFNPRDLMARLGITAELGNYTTIKT